MYLFRAKEIKSGTMTPRKKVIFLKPTFAWLRIFLRQFSFNNYLPEAKEMAIRQMFIGKLNQLTPFCSAVLYESKVQVASL